MAALVFIFVASFSFHYGIGDSSAKGYPRSAVRFDDKSLNISTDPYKNITFAIGENSQITLEGVTFGSLPTKAGISAAAASVFQLLDQARWLSNRTDEVRDEFFQLYKSGELFKDEYHKIRADRLEKINASLKKEEKLYVTLVASIDALDKRMNDLMKPILQDWCSSSPCKNGATCVRLTTEAYCICVDGFEGSFCENRIDYCELYAKSVGGCKNGATCRNMNTGFKCFCPQGFHGRLCDTKSVSCDTASELCGPGGYCMPVNNQQSYRCVCKTGYRSSNSTENPYCDDVDECLSNPCYAGSTCQNMPGFFKCTECPTGMTGNGIHCIDIDECKSPDVCSQKPKVSCQNLPGSYKCGPCPNGYIGDGQICARNPCYAAVKPCYWGATCDPVLSSGKYTFRCLCPEGMHGDGVGENGCISKNIGEIESQSVGECKHGWKQFQNACYKYDNEGVPRNVAETRCAAENSYLTSILSKAEEDFLISLTPGRWNGHFWMGLKKTDDKKWKWDNGSMLSEYINWATIGGVSAPDGLSDDKQRCVRANFYGGWDDWFCDLILDFTGYICKYDIVVPDDSACDKGWTRFGEHCYKVFGCLKNMNQNQASDRCRAEQAHLTTICSDTETEFMKNLLKRHMESEPCEGEDRTDRMYGWIGLVRNTGHGKYAWTFMDGTSCPYANWREQKPDNGGPRETCAEIVPNGQWDDFECTERAASAICQKGIKAELEKKQKAQS